MISKKNGKIWWQTVLRSERCSRRENRLAKIYGAENVFDFSLGNPNVPAPEEVQKCDHRTSE